jgi:hypothetical protein
MKWIFFLTLYFVAGHEEGQRFEFTKSHASEHCRIAERKKVDEVKLMIARREVKSYTLVACHTEEIPELPLR